MFASVAPDKIGERSDFGGQHVDFVSTSGRISTSTVKRIFMISPASRKMIIRTGQILMVSAGLAFLCVSCRQQEPVKITQSTIAEKDSDHTRRMVIVTSLGQRQIKGNHAVFPADLSTRYAIVFVLEPGSLGEDNFTSCTGFCEGIRVTGITGCDCPPPFILVSGAIPKY